MKREYGDYIEDILNAIRETALFTAHISFDRFMNDAKTFNAVVRSLEVIGEAAKSIPEEMREHAPDIPWRRMAEMRDKLIHHYFGVDPEIVWMVVKEELPPLYEKLQVFLRIGDSEDGSGTES